MFDYIKGQLAGKVQTSKGAFLTLEVAGIGYLIEITQRTILKLGEVNSDLKIFTVLLHKEDNMSLCGFLHKEDRDIFKILISVSGVGPKMALTLLDEFEGCELISLVIKGDYKELTRAKGVGPKLAQKIILELKDKLMNFQTSPINIDDSFEVKDEQALQDAQSVLISLGYEREEIKKAISSALKFTKSTDNAEDILKESLKFLSM